VEPVAVDVVVYAAGALVVLATVASALRSVVLPRAVPARLTRRVMRLVRVLFGIRIGRSASYDRRDRILAMYGPVALLSLLVTWLVLVFCGYTAMFWAIRVHPLRHAISVSGSSLLTLGFAGAPGLPGTIMVFTEAAAGLVLLALLITYLPSIYGAFSRREIFVSLLEVRAGTPPSPVALLTRMYLIHGLDRLAEMWPKWEQWFIEVQETQTSFPALPFFRSSVPQHSWVTAAGVVLDVSALRASSVDLPRDPAAELCLRAGYLSLRRIATFFSIAFDADPAPADPISISREEYDVVYDKLKANGVPMKADRDQAWVDFAGWRVNYDTVLPALARLTDAPFAPWVSDRPPPVAQRNRRLNRGWEAPPDRT
jgi:hypothetical protein